MLNILATEGLVCELVAWPYAAGDCAWQQWVPAFASLLATFGLRAFGIGRLSTFLSGLAVFYAATIPPVMLSPEGGTGEPAGGFVFGCLFLFPVASVISLAGLLGGDLFRIVRKNARANASS